MISPNSLPVIGSEDVISHDASRMKRVRQAIVALLQGWEIILELRNKGVRYRLVAADTCDDSNFQEFSEGNNQVALFINRQRYSFITSDDSGREDGLQGATGDFYVLVYGLNNWKEITEIAGCTTMPAEDLSHLLGEIAICPSDTLSLALSRLSEIAELLPAFLIQRIEEGEAADTGVFTVEDEDVLHYRQPDIELIPNCQAPLNLADFREDSESSIKAQIIGFRHGLKEHYAIVIESKIEGHSSSERNDSPLVRVHSSCFTGDLLCSLDCDCHEQLHRAIEKIATDPAGGALLYLNQEGRGIGLTNKIRAYHLQRRRNVDTVVANECLGVPVDNRDFTVASKMLKYLGLSKVRLLSNNSQKASALEEHGITVVDIVPHASHSNRDELAGYYAAKVEKLGHKLDLRPFSNVYGDVLAGVD